MSESGLDLQAIAIGLGVLAVFGAFYWHVFTRFRAGALGLMAWADGRAERQRAGLERSVPESAWRRAAQVSVLTVLVGLLGYQVLTKLQLF